MLNHIGGSNQVLVIQDEQLHLPTNEVGSSGLALPFASLNFLGSGSIRDVHKARSYLARRNVMTTIVPKFFPSLCKVDFIDQLLDIITFATARINYAPISGGG